jgi:hypothetical protein
MNYLTAANWRTQSNTSAQGARHILQCGTKLALQFKATSISIPEQLALYNIVTSLTLHLAGYRVKGLHTNQPALRLSPRFHGDVGGLIPLSLSAKCSTVGSQCKYVLISERFLNSKQFITRVYRWQNYDTYIHPTTRL